MRSLLLGSLIILGINACQSDTHEQHTDSTSLVVSKGGHADVNDWECIAGEKAGIITGASSEQELINRLGKENVSSHDTVYGAEGLFSIGTIIYKGTPNEAHIVWKDTLSFRNPQYVEVGFVEPGNESSVEWHTNTGIKVGTKLTELEKINRKPFSFSGFGWDYGGAVVDWNGGELMDKDNTSYLAVILAYDYEKQELSKLADKLLGDKTFESKNPDAQKLNPHVAHFMISFR